jgi:hypothetical protein
MARHRLANGREVYLSGFVIAPTYAEALEGTPETTSPYIFKGVADRAARILPPPQPLVVVPPTEMPRAPWFCVAELGSRRGARQTNPDYSSRLFVCWFATTTAKSIDAMVRAVLPHLDWEQVAEDYDITYF